MILRFHRLAQREIDKAKDWHEKISRFVSHRFEADLDETLERIRENPSQWPVARGEDRWIKTRRFRYTIYFRILNDDDVMIMAVAHDRRRSGYWKRRKPS